MSASDAEDLLNIDAAIKRITNAVPEYPYLLSAPVTVEPRYHYPSHQEAESWARHTPFRHNEERLQYMTYVYREPGESCFVVRSHIDEERDRLAAQKKTVNGSRPATPLQSTANKKKISLSAYKSKLAAGTLVSKDPSPEKEAVKMVQPIVKTLNGLLKEGLVAEKREEKPSPSLKRHVKYE